MKTIKYNPNTLLDLDAKWFIVKNDEATGSANSRKAARNIAKHNNSSVIAATDVKFTTTTPVSVLPDAFANLLDEILSKGKKAPKKATKPAVVKMARDAVAKVKKTPVVEAIEFRRKSLIENPVFFVFDMADKMKGARRKDVVNACIEAGVAHNTARTQYQYWFTARKADLATQEKLASKK